MKRTERLAVAVMIVGVLAPVASPAWADGGGGEADAFNLTEQALAIVVNTPSAAGEALERVEAALAMEAADPTGEVDIAALEAAADALEVGDLHEAEDALIAALGSDPHVGADEPGQDPLAAEGLQGGDVAAHGLTDRVEGGFRIPSGGDVAALVAAALLAAGGLWLALSRRGEHQ